MSTGTLSVHVSEAKNLPRKDSFSKNDPYAVLRLAHDPNARRTRTIQSGGSNPKWNEEVRFEVNQVHFQTLVLTVDVYDHDRGSKDDFIGRAEVPLSALLSTQASYNAWHNLKDSRSKSAGTIQLAIVFHDRLGHGHGPPGAAAAAPYHAPSGHYAQPYHAPSGHYAPPANPPQYGAYPTGPSGHYAPPPQQQHPPPMQGYGYPAQPGGYGGAPPPPPPGGGYGAPPPPAYGAPPPQAGGYPGAPPPGGGYGAPPPQGYPAPGYPPR